MEEGRAPLGAVVSPVSRASVCPSFDSEKAGDREVQRTMLELLNQLDGFQPNTQVKVSIVTSQMRNMGLRGQGTFSVTWLVQLNWSWGLS